MITRDSWVLLLGILAGLVLYLAGTKPIWEWGYYEYLAFAGYLISVISAKLGTSALAGENDKLSSTKPAVFGLFSVKE